VGVCLAIGEHRLVLLETAFEKKFPNGLRSGLASQAVVAENLEHLVKCVALLVKAFFGKCSILDGFGSLTFGFVESRLSLGQGDGSLLLLKLNGDQPADDCNERQAARRYRHRVAPYEFFQPIQWTRPSRFYRFVVQIAFEVVTELESGLITSIGVLLQRAHGNPVELSPYQSGQFGRFELPAGSDVG